MDEIEDENDEIDDGKLAFVGSNGEKFNFHTFNEPLNFISAIYDGKISLKEAEFKQRDIEKKIEDLRDYTNNAGEEEENEEINGVLIKANNLLKYRDKIIDVFKDGTFSSEHLKKSDAAAYDYVLKDINNFIQKIKLMEQFV